MAKDIKVAVVGLDTSHSVEFVKRMQAPDCPADQRVPGMRATACLRFETPFQNQPGLDSRQKQLEAWGVKVTLDFDEAVSECDAVMIEINDPAPHLDYMQKCATLGKPIFLDKPLADTIGSGRKIAALVASKHLKIMSASSLRFVSELTDACAKVPKAAQGHAFGPLGKAPAGSSIVWYGVHAFEMLQRAMGLGASGVTTVKDRSGVVCVVEYADGRRGLVELTEGQYAYGGTLRGDGKAGAFVVDMGRAYTGLMIEIEKFFRTGKAPLTIEDTLEVMAMLDAAQRSFDSGQAVPVNP